MLNHYWRIVVTGLSFVVFGIGGIVLGLIVFPIMNLLIRNPQRRANAARSVIRYAFRVYIDMMRVIGVLRYEVRGLEKLQRGGMLILANHPTLLDTVFLMAFVKNAECIVKSALWNNPFTRGPVRGACYIKNEGGAELVEACIASLERGNNLIIFPEGTRTPKDGTISMKRGAANIAVRGGRDITPVLLQCDPPTLHKGEKWWHVPSRRFLIQIDVQDDLAIAPFTEGVTDVIAARQLTEFLQNFFARKCQHNA